MTTIEDIKEYKDVGVLQAKIIEVVELDDCSGTLTAISDLLEETRLDGRMLAILLVSAFRAGERAGKAELRELRKLIASL